MGLNAENAYYAYDLYLAGPDAMLAELKTATGRTVMMLGHNPGLPNSRLSLSKPRLSTHGSTTTRPAPQR